MSPGKNWGDFTARVKAPFVLRGVVQFTLLVDIYRRPAEEIRGSVRELHGIGPVVYFAFGRKRT